jgi:plastocyanin domain-containing protein
MRKINSVFGTLVGLGVWLISFPGVAAPSQSGSMTHDSPSPQAFERVEQPLGIKLGVTVTGLGLIGIELWWFLWSKPKLQRARSQLDRQEGGVEVESNSKLKIQNSESNF